MKLKLTFILSTLICLSVFGQSNKNTIFRSGPGDTLSVSIESKYVGSGEMVELDVMALGFDSLAVFEGTISWDTLGLDFVEVKNLGIPNLEAESFGRPINSKDLLSFTWMEPSNDGISIPDSTIIFTLVFEAVGEVDTEALVFFADAPLDVSAADNKLTDVFVKEENATVQILGPLMTSAEVTDLLCFGDEDGSIVLTPSGGLGAYTYLWSNGEETAAIENLNAGNYSFTITDTLTDLTFSESITLTSPDSIEIEFIDESLDGDTLATITASISGGIPGYQIEWSTGDTLETLEGVENGTYGITVTDANGCTVNTEVEVDRQVSSSNSELDKVEWAVFPNPSSGMITVTFDNDKISESRNYRIFNTIGEVVSEGKIIANSNRVNLDLSNNVSGLYFVNVGNETVPVLLKK